MASELELREAEETIERLKCELAIFTEHPANKVLLGRLLKVERERDEAQDAAARERIVATELRRQLGAMTGERDAEREISRQWEEKAGEALAKVDKVSGFAARLVGNACDEHCEKAQKMSFPDFYEAHPKECAWCTQRDLAATRAENERLREALERIRRIMNDVVSVPPRRAPFPNACGDVYGIANAALAAEQPAVASVAMGPKEGE